MEEISQKELKGIYAWMLFITKQRELHLKEQNVALNVFGKGDDSYLVVNIYQSDTEADQFVLQTDERNVTLPLLMEFLRGLDFDVCNLVSFLVEQDFSQSKQINTKNGLSIFYDHQKAE